MIGSRNRFNSHKDGDGRRSIHGDWPVLSEDEDGRDLDQRVERHTRWASYEDPFSCRWSDGYHCFWCLQWLERCYLSWPHSSPSLFVIFSLSLSLSNPLNPFNLFRAQSSFLCVGVLDLKGWIEFFRVLISSCGLGLVVFVKVRSFLLLLFGGTFHPFVDDNLDTWINFSAGGVNILSLWTIRSFFLSIPIYSDRSLSNTLMLFLLPFWPDATTTWTAWFFLLLPSL